MRSGTSVSGATSAPAATIARTPMRAPSRTVAPLPTSASSAMNAACTVQVWPIGAEHGVVPDGRVRLDRDVADEHRRRRDERRRVDRRALSLEAEEWHGLDPRRMPRGPPSFRAHGGPGGPGGG